MSGTAITDHYKVTKADKDLTKPVQIGSECDDDQDFKKLREFDMEWKYGPCIGLARLERWERAAKYGLNPPESIRQLILQHKDEVSYTQCVWNDYHI